METVPVFHVVVTDRGKSSTLDISSTPATAENKTLSVTTPVTFMPSAVVVIDSRVQNIDIQVRQPFGTRGIWLDVTVQKSSINWKRLKDSLGSVIKNLRNRLFYSNRDCQCLKRPKHGSRSHEDSRGAFPGVDIDKVHKEKK